MKPYFVHCCSRFGIVLQRGIEDIVKPEYCACKWPCEECIQILAYWIPDEKLEKEILEDLK